MHLVTWLKRWWRKKLRRRLLISSIITVLLSLIILSYLSFRVSQAGVRFEANQRNAQLANLAAKDINAQFNNTWRNIPLLMLQLATSNEILILQARAMLELRRASPLTYKALYLFDANGRLRLHLAEPLEELLAIEHVIEILRRPPIPITAEISAAYESATNGREFISPTYIVGTDQLPIIYVGIPLFDKQDQINQIVVAEIDLRDTWRRIDEIQIGQTGRAFVVSRDNVIIAHPDRAYIGQPLAPELNGVLAGFEGQTEYLDPISGQTMLAAYSPVGGQSGWGVIVEQERAEALARVNNIAFVGLAVLLVALGLATILTVMIAQGVTRPIQQLAQATQTIADTGDMSRDIAVVGEDEVGQLATTFNQMMASLREAQAHLLKSQAITQELDIAHQIQSSLLPASSLSLPELDIAAKSIPARQVGGDFYGYYHIPPNHQNPHEGLAVAVGDVSGKGLPAALYMAVSSSALAAKAQSIFDVHQLYTELNALLYPRMRLNRMNTALLYIHLARNSRPALWTAQIVNAGLIAPLLRRDEQCDYLDIGGLPLGVLPELIGYTKTELALQANDWLVLCSDGLIEAMNKAGEMYGLERLKKRVAAFRPGQAHDLMDWITADVQTFVNNREVHDDMTVVVIHFKGVVN